MYKKLGLWTLCLAFIGFMSIGFMNAPIQADQLYTIAEQVAQDEQLTTMANLLSRFEDMQTLLDDPDGEFNLLSPVDGAWTYVDAEGNEINLASAISDPVFAEALLRYYIVPTRIYEAGYNSPIEYGTMLPGYSIAVKRNDDRRIVFNDSSVETEFGIPAENGKIILLDSGLPISYFSEMGRMYASPALFTTSGLPLPAESDRTVIEALTEAGDFTIILDLFATFPQVTQRLENGGLYTLVVPTDAAIVDSGWSVLLEQYIADYMADPSAESAALYFLESRIWAGYFDEAALRRFVGQEGRTIEIQTLAIYAKAYLQAFDEETGNIDDVLRIDWLPVNEQPILANNVIIYVQEKLNLPG